MDVPHIISGSIPRSDRALMMPMCDHPRDDPLPRAKPIFGVDLLNRAPDYQSRRVGQEKISTKAPKPPNIQVSSGALPNMIVEVGSA